MTTYFSSDHHFGHRLVADLRGFGEDTDKHDRTIIDNHNAIVRDEDIVWMLGDLCVSERSFEHALACVHEMRGRKRLILGNHDPGHPMHRDAHKWLSRYLLGPFEYVAPFQRIKLQGKEVLMSHFPYTMDRHSIRYKPYRLKDEGMFLLHGHLHSDEKLTSPRELHVGLDAWDLKPVSDQALMQFAKANGMEIG